jgi:hypothetical protein
MTELQTFDPLAPENVVDFTAYKLQRCIEAYHLSGSEQAMAFEHALSLYYLGKLCIEWIEGHPFAIVLEKDAAQALLDKGAIRKKAFDSRMDPDSVDFEGYEDGDEIGAHNQEMTGIPEEDENENPNDSE